VSASTAPCEYCSSSIRYDRPYFYGGDKADNWKDWYRHAISEAERLYEVHLSELKEEGLLP
jgi:hypothetical protein